MEKNNSEFYYGSFAALFALCSGTIFYHLVEHWTWLDAFYFCVVTLATVGYGDIVPKTPAAKIFTCFYIILGIGILAYFANSLVKRAYYRRIEKLKKRKKHF